MSTYRIDLLPENDRTNGWAAHLPPLVHCCDLPNELEFAPIRVLYVAMFLQEVHKLCIFTVAECLGVKAEIDVQRTNMAHFIVVQKQPGNGTSNDDELVTEASENLSNFNQDGFHRRSRPFFVGRRRLRVVSVPPRDYRSHERTSRRRCSADSIPLSPEMERSRYVWTGLVQNTHGAGSIVSSIMS